MASKRPADIEKSGPGEKKRRLSLTISEEVRVKIRFINMLVFHYLP